MKWIEMIHIRSCTGLALDQVRGVYDELKHAPKPRFLKNIHLFQNMMIDSDLALFLYWSNDVPREGSSPLGLRLAASLSDYGSVNHVGWALDSDPHRTER